MALERQFSDEPWPAEGRTLGEIIERLVGPERWAYLLDYIGDRALPDRRSGYLISDLRIAHDLGPRYQAPGDHPYRQAVTACLPFLDDWNSGAIVAKARVGEPLGRLIDIPPPRAGYTLTIRSLLRSVIVDPTTLLTSDPSHIRRYYDVRFFPPFQQAGSSSSVKTKLDPFKTGAAGRPTAKDIVLAEAKRRIRDKEVVPKPNGLAEFSRSLEVWWEKERHKYEPPGPRMKASGIRNCGVRKLWNDALRASKIGILDGDF